MHTYSTLAGAHTTLIHKQGAFSPLEHTPTNTAAATQTVCTFLISSSFSSNITTQLGRYMCEGINHLMQMWTRGRLTYLLLQQWHYKGDWQLHQHMPSRELQKDRHRDTCKWRQLVLNGRHIHWHIYKIVFWNITTDTDATYAGVRLGWLCSIYFWMFWSLNCMLLNTVCQPSSLILTGGLANVIFSTHLKWFLPLFRDWL